MCNQRSLVVRFASLIALEGHRRYRRAAFRLPWGAKHGGKQRSHTMGCRFSLFGRSEQSGISPTGAVTLSAPRGHSPQRPPLMDRLDEIRMSRG
jgi:hypothetical protein